MKNFLITIDGFAGCGKTLQGKKLAKNLKVDFLDTGQIYRFFVWFYEKIGYSFDSEDEKFIKNNFKLLEKKFRYREQSFFYDGKKIPFVSLNNPQIDLLLPKFVHLKIVRQKVNLLILKIVNYKSFVVVGRDLGKYVFPNAEFKFWLTASLEKRTQRKIVFYRNKLFKDQNIKKIFLQESSFAKKDFINKNEKLHLLVKKMLQDRDNEDAHRAYCPMQKADNAFTIDTSELDIDTVQKMMLHYVENFDKNQKYKILIIGKTNAGKSTLFNALIDRNLLLTSKTKNTTRDFFFHPWKITSHHVELIDTIGFEKKNYFDNQKFRDQKIVSLLKKASLILWVVDGKEFDFASYFNERKFLKKYFQKIILVINKVKINNFLKHDDLKKIGCKRKCFILARTKENLPCLIKKINNFFASLKPLETKETVITKKVNVILLGKTNVGKSTFLNNFFRENLIFTSPKEHTTTNFYRQSFIFDDYLFNFFDTAGIRRKKNHASFIEKIAKKQIEKLLKNMDLGLFFCDVSLPLTVQDCRIIALIKEYELPFIIVGNKVDKIRASQRIVTNDIRDVLKNAAPNKIIFFSSINENFSRSGFLKNLINFLQKK